MMGNDLYIGAPNGIVLCVDAVNTGGCSGRYYHAYSTEPVVFDSFGQMLFKMESFFDDLSFPHRGNSERNFVETGKTYRTGKERNKVMSDNELLAKRGDQETFIVRVQHRQNNTWQGRITWAEKNKTLNFRSIWEMIHLMENALYNEIPENELPEIRSWEE